MQRDILQGFASLIKNKDEEILAQWRGEVSRLSSAANLDAPTINDQVPQLLENLAEALTKVQQSNVETQTETISAEHGLLRWQAGFDITEVVGEYNILRGCLQDTAEKHGLLLNGATLRIVNQVFDEAIGKAVKAFETMMTIELQHRHEEHIAFLLHDLRTPLEALSLSTSVLDRSLELELRNDSVESAISVLRGNIDRLSDRVRQVLSVEKGLGRTFAPKYTFVNLREQVDKLVHDLGPLASAAETQVSNDVPSDLRVYSDPKLLAQIIQNLLSNALKFTHRGTVQIGGRTLGDDGSVECWIKDSGKGIAPERLERIFERFETDSQPERRGIGLGLAIVKEIVELHNGQLRVESEVGKGATFTFTIPTMNDDRD